MQAQRFCEIPFRSSLYASLTHSWGSHKLWNFAMRFSLGEVSTAEKIKVLSGWNGNFCGRVIWLCVCTVFLSLSILDKKEELFNIIFHTHESTQWNDFFLFSLPLLRLRRYVCGVLSVNNNNCCAFFFQPNGFPESERDWSSYMELYSVVSSHSFICLCLSFFLFAILDRARHERRVPMRVLEGIISINVWFFPTSSYSSVVRRVVNSAASVSMCMEWYGRVATLFFFSSSVNRADSSRGEDDTQHDGVEKIIITF